MAVESLSTRARHQRARHLRWQLLASFPHRIFPLGPIARVAPCLIVGLCPLGRKYSPLRLEFGARLVAGGRDAVGVRNLDEQGLIKGSWLNYFTNGWLSASGWERIDQLKHAHVSSRYALFARQFRNDELNTLYERCLKQAVADTGFELRIVTQKAGHIDAIIEDEIRRCRFLIADLSDDNAGAYRSPGSASCGR